jgi:O-antigen/teichoic acid export membrane protein
MLKTLKNIMFSENGLSTEFLRGAAGSLALKAINALLVFVVSIVLARSLGPDGLGLYTLVFSLMLLLSIPVQMGLPTLVVREVARYHYAKHWGLLRGLLLRTSQTVLLLSVLIVLIVSAAFFGLYNNAEPDFQATGTWALFLLPLISMSLLCGAALRGLRRVLLGQLPEFLLKPATFLVLLGVVGLVQDLTPSLVMLLHCAAACLALLLGALLLIGSLPAEVSAIKPKYDTRVWFRSAMSFSFLSAFMVLNDQVGIIMLGLLGTNVEVGQYRVVVSVGALIVFALTAMGAILAPHIARLYSAGDIEHLQRIVTWSVRGVVAIALPVSLVFIFWGAPLLGSIYGESYREASMALVVLSIGQLFNACMGPVGLILNMTGHEQETIKGVVVATGLNVVLAVVLIPLFGVLGAAAAAGTSLVVWNLILCRVTWLKVGLQSTVLLLPLRRK